HNQGQGFAFLLNSLRFAKISLFMDLIPSSLQHYAERLTSPETEVLAALNRETNLKVNQAQMLSGHWQGVFLQMITHLLQPKRVLEIGTFTGYTAIC
ncbi:hypothetical protein OSI40_25330, partial [Mycobacterium ulcerans]